MYIAKFWRFFFLNLQSFGYRNSTTSKKKSRNNRILHFSVMIEVFDFSIKGFYYNKLNIIHQFIRNRGKILKMNLQSFGYRNSNVSK
nr:MAG TPA: hypothetical protein [Caudoviricetes sp.]